MEVSHKLLVETQLTPEQVVNNVGYEDISSFRRLFKQTTGLTLAEYRQRYARRL
ncbi:helix-turn-helix domain-containing protein [Litoribacillus peritrichatus]|uniref:helix-turn-helix domain-containing protein n=1 Tax=Litoribacillus peritrichatus TaxID=718191 RepID=UPI003CD0AADD